jgi:hypothetical protein
VVQSLESLITVLIDIDQWKWRNLDPKYHGFNYSDPSVTEPKVADLVAELKNFATKNYIDDDEFRNISVGAINRVTELFFDQRGTFMKIFM